MKKLISLIFMGTMMLSLAACGSHSKTSVDSLDSSNISNTNEQDETVEEAPETVTVTALDATGEPTEVTVPYNPERVAVLDMAALDIIANLDLGERVVGSAGTSLDYLAEYTTREGVANLGTIKEADMEAVMECEPEVIFIGGRLSSSYDALREIAPVVYLATDSKLGVVESTRVIADTIASIFGKENEIEEKFEGFAERIALLQEAAKGKTAVIGMCTSGSFNVIGNSGRCSIIGGEIGFENLCADGGSYGGNSSGNSNESAHGNEASFELLVSLDPDYIFVLDRDAAIGTNGAQLAKDIMENELVMSTNAYQNGHMIVLEHSAVWYTAEGGVTALDRMLADLESVLLK